MCLQMIQVLSIDLDSIWEGTETIYRHPGKKINTEMVDFIKTLSHTNWEKLEVGSDHHKMCMYLDKYTTKYRIDHIDSHHDLFADDQKTWLNPLFIRAKRVNIGNFLFQLLREGNLISINWLIPDSFDIDNCKFDIEQNIGKYYSDKVVIKRSNQHVYLKDYDLIYISLSPEWIPSCDVHIVEEVLSYFKIPKTRITNYIQEMHRRWACNDDNTLTQNDRFCFDYLYK
jgi:hypothetical protein